LPSLFVSKPPHQARHRRDFMLVVQVAGLLATAWLIWSISLVPRLEREPVANVVAQAVAYTLLACLASALIALSLYLLIARSFSEEAIRMGLRTSGTAIWFAAATILLAQVSPATLPAALVLVISATRLLYSQWRLVHPVRRFRVSAPIQHPFFDPPPSPRFRELLPALAAAAAIESGVLLFPANYPLLAAALFCLSVAMVTFCALRAGAMRAATADSLPRSILGFFLTLILAAGVTVGGLAGGLRSGSQWHSPLQGRRGPFESARALLHKVFEENGEGPAKDPVTNLYFPPAGSVEITDNSFPGVILLPEIKREQPAVVVPSFSWSRISPEIATVKPFRIPFSGVYWMYRPPFDRPPRTSHVQQGSPLMLSFRTTDHAPMSMEAYQKLDRAIDLKCCHAIQIAISSTDPYPGTVALELVVIDSRSAGQPMLSLGTVSITSRPPSRSLAGSAAPTLETLEYGIPVVAGLHQFDVIKVIYHRDRVRQERSARISIEGFVLSPL
jgi:hypothetical protein